MRIVRRAALVVSLVLIVAIAVGYFARTTELSRDRDRDLTAAATLGAARLTAVIDATSVAARTAAAPDPEAVTAAFSSLGDDVTAVASELDDERLTALAEAIRDAASAADGSAATISDIADELAAAGEELRDSRLVALAERARAAAADTTPAAATAALSAVYPGLGVCVVTAADRSCAGDGPMPTDDVLDDAEDRRDEVDRSGQTATSVTIYDSLLTIEATGPEVTVLSVGTAGLIDRGNLVTTWATTLLPAGFEANGFNVAQDARQTWAPVEAANGIFVIAAGGNEVNLPTQEYRFYVAIFSLAMVLMLHAGVTLLTEQRSLVERASFDTLTKLPNRAEFERRAAELLATAERTKSAICLLLFDLDGFKKVNDTYGHLAGDEMLRLVGVRLRKAVREGDVVARWGGDEFVVMMPGIGTEEMGSRRARQLAEHISGRARLECVEEPLRVKVSVGVAIWPNHGAELNELVIAADQAMYQAKREGAMWQVAEPVPIPPLETATPETSPTASKRISA